MTRRNSSPAFTKSPLRWLRDTEGRPDRRYIVCTLQSSFSKSIASWKRPCSSAEQPLLVREIALIACNRRSALLV